MIILAFLSPLLVLAQEKNAPQINWPGRYHPANSKFFVHNEIQINAPAEKIWSVLTEALQWETWYKGAKNLQLIPPGDSILNSRSVFTWQTMGLRFTSTIQQFQPHRVLAWESRKKSIQGYHVWLILPHEAGCRVITEESQNGWLTFFEKTFQRKKLHRLHDEWLRQLKKKAEAAML